MVVHEINKQQRLYYDNEIMSNKNNRNGMWKSLRHLMKSSKSNHLPAELMAEVLNECFLVILARTYSWKV